MIRSIRLRPRPRDFFFFQARARHALPELARVVRVDLIVSVRCGDEQIRANDRTLCGSSTSADEQRHGGIQTPAVEREQGTERRLQLGLRRGERGNFVAMLVMVDMRGLLALWQPGPGLNLTRRGSRLKRCATWQRGERNDRVRPSCQTRTQSPPRKKLLSTIPPGADRHEPRRGMRAVGHEGRRYLDMTAGIAVCVLGHGDQGLATRFGARRGG